MMGFILGLNWGYIGVMLGFVLGFILGFYGLYWVYIRVILG